MPVLLLKFHLTLSALPSAPQVPDVAGGVFHSSSSAANATVGTIVNSIQSDNIADNNRFFITFPPYFISLNGINIKKRFQDMATHDLKAFSYLLEQHKRAEFYLLCAVSSVLHRESVCQVLFHGVHLLLPNKAQKRLTASSLMLAAGCHCGCCRFRSFWLCVPIFRRVYLFLRHCA